MRAPPAFSIFYATGWDEAVLRVRMLNADGTPQHPVRTTGSGGMRAEPQCSAELNWLEGAHTWHRWRWRVEP